MDWTKAKNILIIALIATNIFLIYTYVIQGDRESGNEEGALIAHLESKNIYIDMEIPDWQSKLPVLTVEYDESDEDVIKEALRRQKPMKNKNFSEANLQDDADKFITSCDFMSENVVEDKISVQGDNTIVSYKNKVDEYYLEESYMRCIFKNDKIVEFERYWLKPLDFGNQKQAIVSAGAALMEFANKNNIDESGQIYRITDMEIVYWLDIESFESEAAVMDTALPAWKITYNDDKIYYISAFE